MAHETVGSLSFSVSASWRRFRCGLPSAPALRGAHSSAGWSNEAFSNNEALISHLRDSLRAGHRQASEICIQISNTTHERGCGHRPGSKIAQVVGEGATRSTRSRVFKALARNPTVRLPD